MVKGKGCHVRCPIEPCNGVHFAQHQKVGWSNRQMLVYDHRLRFELRRKVINRIDHFPQICLILDCDGLDSNFLRIDQSQSDIAVLPESRHPEALRRLGVCRALNRKSLLQIADVRYDSHRWLADSQWQEAW